MKKRSSENKFVVHPLFLALSIFFVVIGQGFYFVIVLFVVILHEYAHFFVAKSLGYKLKQVCLLPYGAQLNLSKSISNSNHEILIAISGPLFNLFLAILFIAVWWIFPITYIYTEMFVNANLIIALFNLLPLSPLDGSRILLALLSKLNKRSQGYKIVNILNVIVSILLFILFVLSAFYKLNITLGIIAIFIFVGAFEKDEAYEYLPLLTLVKHNREFQYPLRIKYYAVTKKISKYKIYRLINQDYYLVIVVLSENMKPIRYIYESELYKYFS